MNVASVLQSGPDQISIRRPVSVYKTIHAPLGHPDRSGQPPVRRPFEAVLSPQDYSHFGQKVCNEITIPHPRRVNLFSQGVFWFRSVLAQSAGLPGRYPLALTQQDFMRLADIHLNLAAPVTANRIRRKWQIACLALDLHPLTGKFFEGAHPDKYAQVAPNRFNDLLRIEGGGGKERLQELKIEAEVRIAQAVASTAGTSPFRLGYWQPAFDQVQFLKRIQVKGYTGAGNERPFANLCQGMRTATDRL
jgi:hypothetical protein